MVSKSLEKSIAKHEQMRETIVSYAQELFPDDNRLISGEISIEEISKIITKAENDYFLHIDTIHEKTDKETKKNAKIRAKEKIASYYQDLPKMIEKYRKEDIEMQKLIKREEEEIHPKHSVLPINPILERIADDTKNEPILRRWADGKYLCYDMQNFIKEYTTQSKKKIVSDTPVIPISINLIRHYLLDHKTEEPYDYKYVSNMIGMYRFDRDLK